MYLQEVGTLKNIYNNNTIIPPRIINSKCLISNLQSVELDFTEKIVIGGEKEEWNSG